MDLSISTLKQQQRQYLEFHETVDQLYEIFQKYQHTHSIIIGGDLNEDLSYTSQINKRKRYLLNFIDEFKLKYTLGGKTFINSAGQECSEIDYCFIPIP